MRTPIRQSTVSRSQLVGFFASASAFPMASLILLYAFVLRARCALGVWPQPYRPDPKSLGFDLHHQAVWWSIALAACSPAALLALPFLRPQWRKNRATILMGFACFTITWLLWDLLLRLDPGAFSEWFAD